MPYKFDKNRNRYRAPNGRFISPQKIRTEIDAVIETSEKRMRTAARNFNDGKINLPAFQIEMRDLLKSTHIIAGTIATGGKAQMLAKDWGEVGRGLKEQYKFLNNFARQISQGRVSAAQIENRARSYAASGRVAYERKVMIMQTDNAETKLARRVLSVAEHCQPCVSWARKGFVAIETLPPLGSLTCRSHCRCRFEYQ